MVGGEVKEVLVRADRIWINTVERLKSIAPRQKPDECAIYVERTATTEKIRPGDSLWWQASYAFWTPAAERDSNLDTSIDGKDYDIRINRIGYSGVSHPAQKLIEKAFDNG